MSDTSTAVCPRIDFGHEAQSFDVQQPSNAPTTVQRLDAPGTAEDDTCLVCHGKNFRPPAQAYRACSTRTQASDGPPQ